MKKIVAILLAALMMLSAVAALAEGEVKIAQIEYAAHGASCFAVISAVVQDDVIIAAKIDEFQFMGDRADLAAVGVTGQHQIGPRLGIVTDPLRVAGS